MGTPATPASPAITGIDTPASGSPRPSLSLGDEERPSISLTDRVNEKLNGAGATEEKEANEERPAPPVKTASSDSVTNLQESITNLLAERADLQKDVADLTAQLGSARSDQQLLAEAREVTARLEGEKCEMEERLNAAGEEAAKGKETATALEAARRELEGAKKETEDARSAREALEAELEEREGKEGERVAELEKTLERARQREGALETEVGRLKQVR